jgi:hypothetical protein
VAWGPHGAHSTHFGESVDGQRVSRTKPKHIKHRLKLRAPCESAPRALLAASSDGPGTGGRHVLQPSAVSRIYRNKSHSGLALSLRPRHPHVWRRQRSVGLRRGTLRNNSATTISVALAFFLACPFLSTLHRPHGPSALGGGPRLWRSTAHPNTEREAQQLLYYSLGTFRILAVVH